MKIRLFLLIALIPFLAGCGDDEPDSGKQSVVDISGGEQTDDGFRYGDFYYTFGDNVATLAKADKLIVNAVIPAKVKLNGEIFDVAKIGRKAFEGCSAMRSITIPSSITNISCSFGDCSSLTKVEVLDLAAWCKISFNGYDANPLCKGALYHNGREIKDLTIPNSVTSIGDYAFSGCSDLTSVTIPNSVTSIGDYAFNGCTGLTSVTIPNTVTKIGDCTFGGCSGLTSVTIPNSVTSIGWSAFYNCSGLTSVTIPNSVTSICEYAFRGCSGMTSVTIGNSVTSIGDGAFQYCSGLTSVTIPNSVTSIRRYAFEGCRGLTSVTIGDSVKSIGDSAFSGCSGLTSVTIGDSVKSIGNYAFSGCSGLTSVTIGNSVTSIGDSAFRNCSGLTSASIGNSVSSIGEKAFYCEGLKDVKCFAKNPPSIGIDSFYTYSIPLSVPSESVEKYKTAYGWSRFKTIIGI